MHSALAAAQLRQQQQHQFTQADLLALSRSGALSGLSGLLGGGAGSVSSLLSGLGGSQGFASELEGIQRLEELERRQRLFAAGAAGGAQPPQQAPSSLSAAQPALRRPEETPASPKVMQDTSSPRLSAARPEPKQPVAAAPVPDAAPASEEGKEELEKAPGSVIVPCRARGMPMDHNFKVSFVGCDLDSAFSLALLTTCYFTLSRRPTLSFPRMSNTAKSSSAPTLHVVMPVSSFAIAHRVKSRWPSATFASATSMAAKK